MQALIENIARALVESPDQVSVSAGANGLLELRVASTDLARVIGRQGRTARSLRTIVSAAAAKQNKPCTLEIVE